MVEQRRRLQSLFHTSKEHIAEVFRQFPGSASEFMLRAVLFIICLANGFIIVQALDRKRANIKPVPGDDKLYFENRVARNYESRIYLF